MTPESTHNPVLADLLARFLDGELSDADHASLAATLRDNPDAQQLYLDYCWTHALLRQELGGRIAGFGGQWPDASGQWPVVSGQGVESRESRVESYADLPELPNPRTPDSPIINLQISKSPNLQISIPTPHAPRPSSLAAWAFSYAVATLLVGIALLGAWFSTITHPDPNALLANIQRSKSSGAGEKENPQLVFVGHVSGMVDCQFADDKTATVSGAAVALGRRYALKSGLMEITYQSGAKVILQGPCDYTVESARGGFLQVGKLTARVASGQWPVASEEKAESGKRKAENQKSEIRNQKSRSPLATSHSPLFSIRTPTALVEDLGTEFGVEVLQSGDTASHVFQGQVRLMVAGAGDVGRGTGDENPESPNPRTPNPEIVLSAGQSARVAKGANGNAIEQLPSGGEQPKYARRLLETPAELDLLDIVCGGNGAGHRREIGIDQATGGRRTVISSDWRRGDQRYWPVAGMGLIDGVFVPDGRTQSVQLDSAGHVCEEFPQSVGAAFGLLWARAAVVAEKDRNTNWIYALADAEKFMPRRQGLLAFHASAGITFDLQVMRKIYRDARPAEFHATVGLGDPRPFSASADGTADFWVFVDGQAKFKRTELRQRDGAVEVRVALGAKDRFLTLAATDAGDGNKDDCMVVGDPVIKLNPIEPAARKEGR
jgi:hypothetical protein